MGKTIKYKGVTIEVWDQSIRCSPGGGALPMWFRQPTDVDIEGVKRVIDAGRASMAREIHDLQKQGEKLLGERG